MVGKISSLCFELMGDEVFFPLVWSDYYMNHIEKISYVIQNQIKYEIK